LGVAAAGQAAQGGGSLVQLAQVNGAERGVVARQGRLRGERVLPRDLVELLARILILEFLNDEGELAGFLLLAGRAQAGLEGLHGIVKRGGGFLRLLAAPQTPAEDSREDQGGGPDGEPKGAGMREGVLRAVLDGLDKAVALQFLWADVSWHVWSLTWLSGLIRNRRMLPQRCGRDIAAPAARRTKRPPVRKAVTVANSTCVS